MNKTYTDLKIKLQETADGLMASIPRKGFCKYDVYRDDYVFRDPSLPEYVELISIADNGYGKVKSIYYKSKDGWETKNPSATISKFPPETIEYQIFEALLDNVP